MLPSAQCADLRNALTWLAAQPGVAADRLGLWGTSFAGGHVLQVAALDRRVRAVVSQVPGLGLWPYLRQRPADEREALLASLVAERDERLRRHEQDLTADAHRRVRITAPEGEESLLGAGGLDWHLRNEAAHPTFHNEITVSSLAQVLEHQPASFAEDIAPTPLLMIVANQDRTAPPEPALAAFHRAGQPKRLVTFDGDHYDVYERPEIVELATGAARDFFRTHLTPTPRGAA